MKYKVIKIASILCYNSFRNEKTLSCKFQKHKEHIEN